MFLRPVIVGSVSLISFFGISNAKPLPVTSVQTNVTSQILPAAMQTTPLDHTAAFTIQAFSHNKWASHEPVTFYIGVMKPGSGIPPTTWISSRSRKARQYIVKASRFTNRFGQARLVLKGQSAQTMEMIAVKAGNFSSLDQTTNHALAALDAWWTTPSSTPHANFSDTITVRPFMTKTSKSAHPLRVVAKHDGKPVSGVTIDSYVNPGTSQASEITQTTNAQGAAQFSIPVTSSGAAVAVKSFGPSTSSPFAGGAIAYFAPK